MPVRLNETCPDKCKITGDAEEPEEEPLLPHTLQNSPEHLNHPNHNPTHPLDGLDKRFENPMRHF